MKKPMVTLEETYIDKANKKMDMILMILGTITIIVLAIVMLIVS